MNIQYYKKDIQTLDDIKFFVDTFYDKIRQDDLLAVIFNNKINDKWQQHLEKMYCFWQTVLLDEHTYFGSPFVPHAKLPVDKIHFERWIEIINTTIDDLLVGEKAERAKWQGNRMAEMIQYKIEHYRKNTSTPLL